MIKALKNNINFESVLFFISVLLVGGFNEYVSCALSCAMCVYCFLKIAKNKQIYIQKDLFSISVITMCLFYGITCIWAIDSGMAFIGFLKFLPIVLYMFLLWQQNDENNTLDILPYFAVGVVIVSVIGAQIPVIKDFFVVAGRFAGVFQYPNTFALFLLISELLLFKKAKKIIDFVCLAVLVGGILYTGSRTVFILFVISNFVMLLLVTNKKTRSILLAVTIAAAVCVAILMFAFKDNAIIARYLNISFGASTFVGRILYFVDALPLLLKYPFGMGYMGYFYVQHSIQTGVYNISYVHNDFLQFFLDIGFVPALLFVAAVIKFFFAKNVSVARKLIVATFCAHTLFDFNLQYVSMFFLLILLVKNDSDKKSVKIQKTIKPVAVGAFLLNLYMMVALVLSHYNALSAANKMYPYNTRNNLSMLEKETELAQADKIADHILKQNKAYFAPYSVKSKYAYSIGDFAGVIENKNAAIERYPFKYSEYKEYCVMLINGAIVFERQNDQSSVDVCNREILYTYEKFEENVDRLSKLGKKITEQPNLDFSKNVMEYINNLKKSQVSEN